MIYLCSNPYTDVYLCRTTLMLYFVSIDLDIAYKEYIINHRYITTRHNCEFIRNPILKRTKKLLTSTNTRSYILQKLLNEI